MVKNSLDGKDSYKEIKSQKLTADKNKEWIRIETDYVLKEGDAQAYFQVFMIKIYIFYNIFRSIFIQKISLSTIFSAGRNKNFLTVAIKIW